MDESARPTRPKSAERIRAALESVHEHRGAAPQPGPLKSGLRPEDMVVVESFRDPANGRKFQQRLLQAGIMSNGERRQGRLEVLVDVDDLRRAAAVLAEHAKAYPDRERSDARRIFDFALLFSALATTIAFCGVAGNCIVVRQLPTIGNLALLLGFMVYGAVLGALLGGLNNPLRREGRAQFGIRDLMLLAALVGMAMILQRYVRMLL